MTTYNDTCIPSLPICSSEGFPELIGLKDLPDDQRVEDDDGDVGNGLQEDQLHPHLEELRRNILKCV
jgi:hypothetical protein